MNKTINKAYGTRKLGSGVTVSNNTFETGLNNNDLIFGPPGCGKTGGYVVPMLQTPTDNMIIVDTKNNLARGYAQSLRDKGYTVHILDFTEPQNSTCGYNPLAYIRRTGKNKYNEKDVKAVAEIIVPSQDSKDPFWDMSARKYIAMLISYVMFILPKKEQNLATVIRLHKEMCSGKLQPVLEETAEMYPDSRFTGLYQMVSGLQSSDKTWACVLEFASTAFNPYDVDEMNCILAQKKTLNFTKLAEEKTALFLNISDMDRSCDNVLNLFYKQAFQMLTLEANKTENGRLKMPIRFIMDDFASGNVITDFDKIISVIRSRDISVSLIIQSLSQLNSLYGQGPALTIMNNCDHLVCYGGHDPSTMDYLSLRANKPINKIMSKDINQIFILESGKPAQLVSKIPAYSIVEPDDTLPC